MSDAPRTLTGLDALSDATDIMLWVRETDPMAGLLEAGDLAWWWATEPKLAAPSLTTVFDGPDGRPLVAVVAARRAGGEGEADRIDLDLVGGVAPGTPGHGLVIPWLLDRLADPAFHPDATVAVMVDERDEALATALSARGIGRVPDDDMVQFAQRPSGPPAGPSLPAGWRFADGTAPGDGPHHLARRNGAAVHDRLLQTALYRPELDLRVLTDDGTLAAYCLLWRDGGEGPTGVGHFEPVRTEDAFQGRGVGTALMAEGIRRLLAAGATVIKVETYLRLEPGRALYARAGFDVVYRRLARSRPPVSALQ